MTSPCCQEARADARKIGEELQKQEVSLTRTEGKNKRKISERYEGRNVSRFCKRAVMVY